MLRDPQADKFRQVVSNKIKEFRTLKQLDQTLQKQTPRITQRPEKTKDNEAEHKGLKKLALQVKLLNNK